MAYSKDIVASYDDFEDYWLAMKDTIPFAAVIIGDLEDVQEVQKNASEDIYPLLFVHVPPFESFNSGGNKNRFDVDFAVLIGKKEDITKRELYNTAREKVMDIQKQLEQDTENGMFDFDGRLQAEPKTNATFGKCYGWFVSFTMSTPGVGIDSDYRD
jgi:hypothetical protein